MKKFLLAALVVSSTALAGGDKGPNFKTLDVNGDKSLSAEEAAALPDFDFAAADVDKDNKITAKELKKAHAHKGHKTDAAPAATETAPAPATETPAPTK